MQSVRLRPKKMAEKSWQNLKSLRGEYSTIGREAKSQERDRNGKTRPLSRAEILYQISTARTVKTIRVPQEVRRHCRACSGNDDRDQQKP